MDVDGERLDGHRVEPPGPGRHHAAAPVGDRLDDRRLVRAVEPDGVGQVRRAELAVALAVRRRDRPRNCRRRPSCRRRDRRRRASADRRASARSSRPSTISSRLSMPSRPKAGIWLSRAFGVGRSERRARSSAGSARACRPTASHRRSGWDSPWRRRRPRRDTARSSRRTPRGPAHRRSRRAPGRPRCRRARPRRACRSSARAAP